MNDFEKLNELKLMHYLAFWVYSHVLHYVTINVSIE